MRYFAGSLGIQGPIEPNGVLPKWARRELSEAAKTPITAADPLARTRAIDEALERIRALVPEHFRSEEVQP